METDESYGFGLCERKILLAPLPGSMGFSPILERKMGRERDTERKAWVCVFFRVNGLRIETVRRGWVRDEWQFSIFSLDSKGNALLFFHCLVSNCHLLC